jgi:acetoin utilization protein AcuB
MQIAEVMSVFPVTVDARSSAREALATAELHGIHHLVAVDGSELVGVVCRCNLEAARASDAVAHCMRSPAVTVLAGRPIELAARTLTDCGIGCLPVLDDDGGLLGIVTRRDLRQAGALPDLPGVDRCAHCGTGHHLRPPRCPDEPVSCFHCAGELRQTPVSGVRTASRIQEVA